MVKTDWEKILEDDVAFLKNQLKKLQNTKQIDQKIVIIEEIISFWQKKRQRTNEKT